MIVNIKKNKMRVEECFKGLPQCCEQINRYVDEKKYILRSPQMKDDEIIGFKSFLYNVVTFIPKDQVQTDMRVFSCVLHSSFFSTRNELGADNYYCAIVFIPDLVKSLKYKTVRPFVGTDVHSDGLVNNKNFLYLTEDVYIKLYKLWKKRIYLNNLTPNNYSGKLGKEDFRDINKSFTILKGQLRRLLVSMEKQGFKEFKNLEFDQRKFGFFKKVLRVFEGNEIFNAKHPDAIKIDGKYIAISIKWYKKIMNGGSQDKIGMDCTKLTQQSVVHDAFTRNIFLKLINHNLLKSMSYYFDRVRGYTADFRKIQ